jgi:GDP/UDP-N,N'-diacetylbacillosamine 2-epimerase (hydrolysing)
VKIHYVTGSRADFGLMRRCLLALRDAGGHEVELVVTGQHTQDRYGYTSADIAASGLAVAATIPVALSGADGAEMALAMAEELRAMTALWQAQRPDLVLLLGDRGEMLAGALAAVHLGIAVGHVGGGERSGTLDESFRHAVSKLAHFHFPATPQAAERLARMGEDPATIHLVGAPGLVGLAAMRDQGWLRARFGLREGCPVALTLFHPVVQEAAQAGEQMRAVLAAAAREGLAQIVLRPNSDAGGAGIDAVLDGLGEGGDIRLLTHLERDEYCRVLASCDVMLGNSSSGIIESASFGTPCVNIGHRQRGRERNANTIDVPEVREDAIAAAIRAALAMERHCANIYGNGTADTKLTAAVARLELSRATLEKLNAY